MATTTNYGWTTPDDTALVKDGASAIRTLGSSIDTTTKALNPSTTLGDIEYRSSTANTNTRLALGTAGQILQVNSGATAPEWATPTSGGITLISETVASANTSISLSSIPQTYKQLLLVWTGIYAAATGSRFGIRFNNTAGTAYENSNIYWEAGVIQQSASASSSILDAFGSSATGASLYQRAQGHLFIDNYASTTKVKQYNTEFSYEISTVPANRFHFVNGTFNDTTAITSVDIVRTTGTGNITNATNTSIRLYGLS